MFLQNGYDSNGHKPGNGYSSPDSGLYNGSSRVSTPNTPETKPIYALEHLYTYKITKDSEIHNPKEKLKLLVEMDKSGGIWPSKMYMCFSGQWLLILDSEMKEIENFPGSMIQEPTAFISEDPTESFNNLLIFSVQGMSLTTSEMHIFQASNVSAVHLVQDLRSLCAGNIITIDRNETPIAFPKNEKSIQAGKDQYGLAAAAAEVAAERNAQDRLQQERDILVINHCFEDICRFVARMQYAAEAMRELELRPNEHDSHGAGLLVSRSRPPTESDFQDILAKHKLALIYAVKLQNHFPDANAPIHNLFTSLLTCVTICNDINPDTNIPQNVVNPLLRRETVNYLNSSLNLEQKDLWLSLGSNWTVPKDQFKDHQSAFHPIFFDEWCPDWVVDEEVAYLPPAIKKTPTPPPPSSINSNSNKVWLSRLQSRNVKVAEVMYSKTSDNDKELDVIRGEYLEIIDDSRNWWKARNSTGRIGYVPHTILIANNFDTNSHYTGRDTDSITSSIDMDHINKRNTMTNYQENSELIPADPQSVTANQMSRSYSMPASSHVPAPPPMPPPDSEQSLSPGGTLKRNMAAVGTLAAYRARNDNEAINDEALLLQGTINDELKFTLQQREKRRDLEILKTPQIYINQNSSKKEVEEWLRGKGFSDMIVVKLRSLNGEELFALSPHIIEEYFGQKESRRLVSQIVLQKNICEYKTIRSSELKAKLAKARQKIDSKNDPNETF